jgi:glycine cleavage system H protein
MTESRRNTLDSKLAPPILNLEIMAEKEVKISEQHVWVGIGDQHVYLGLTNYIQGALGTVISFELPDVGDNIVEGEIFAEIESVSTVHEFLSPISGTVLAVNPQLDDHPSIINEDPYSEGWLIEVRLKNRSELNELMDMDEYYHFVFTDKS